MVATGSPGETVGTFRVHSGRKSPRHTKRAVITALSPITYNLLAAPILTAAIAPAENNLRGRGWRSVL